MYEVIMDIKWWSGGYSTITKVFEDEAAFDKWWSSHSEISYKVIGIKSQKTIKR